MPPRTPADGPDDQTSGTVDGPAALGRGGWDIRASTGEAENPAALVRFRRDEGAFVVWWIWPKVAGVDETWARHVAEEAEAALRDRLPRS